MSKFMFIKERLTKPEMSYNNSVTHDYNKGFNFTNGWRFKGIRLIIGCFSLLFCMEKRRDKWRW